MVAYAVRKMRWIIVNSGTMWKAYTEKVEGDISGLV